MVVSWGGCGGGGGGDAAVKSVAVSVARLVAVAAGGVKGFNINLKSDIIICEQFISNSKKNVLRGIHKSPYDKYVTILNGKVIDYIIDFTNNKITLLYLYCMLYMKNIIL